MISRRKFFGMIAAGLALVGLKPQTVEYAENITAPAREWWQEGDYLTRPTARDRWMRAQSPNALIVGHEFGRYGGNGQIDNYGPITAKTQWGGQQIWTTQQHVFGTLLPYTRTVT